ncbi:hypothetical protein MMC29_001005 [Sticta canariensis]|nr:hypothetical protein [Sticta canariensis]
MTNLLEFVLNQGELFRRARLPSLYSDFSLQRYTNPDGFSANIAAWEDVLIKANGEGLIPAGPDGQEFLSLRTSEELLQSLETREFGRPLALGTVIDEAVLHQHLIPVEEFLHNSSSIYDQGWFVRPRWLLLWGYRQLGATLRTSASTKMQNGRYVIVEIMEKVANQMLSELTEGKAQVDRVYTMSMFRKEVTRILNLKAEVTDTDLSIILKFLARDKGAIFYDREASTIVKFSASDEITSPISVEDKTIASLRSLINDLNQQVDLLTSRNATLADEAKMAIKKRNRPLALRVLRSKKMTEDNLMQRLETLSKLEGISAKIEQASDQIAIVRAIKNSTGILRKFNQQVGKIETVEDTMEELQREMKNVDQVSEIIEDVRRDTSVDDYAIDEELENLAQQVRVDEERKEAQETQEKLVRIEVPSTLAASEGLQTTDFPGSGQVSFNGPEEREDPLVTESTDAFLRMTLNEKKDVIVEDDRTQQRRTQVMPGPIADG